MTWKNNRLLLTGGLVGAVIIIAIAYDFMTPHAYSEQSLLVPLKSPVWSHVDIWMYRSFPPVSHYVRFKGLRSWLPFLGEAYQETGFEVYWSHV